MKNFLLVVYVLPAFAFAQVSDNDFLGRISLSVMMDEQRESLSADQKSKIESKIIGLVTRYGVSGNGPSNFVINPRFEIYSEQTVVGMQNLFALTIDLNLFIKQYKTNIVYATYSKSLQGTGYNRNEAIVNAISQINADDPAFKVFIEEGKNKILDFYNSKCDNIISEADKYSGMNDYETALAILMSVPTEATPCYDKVKRKSLEVFKQYQTKNCESILLHAKAQIAANQFLPALNVLSSIDPTSSCYSMAKELINSTEEKLDEQSKIEWNRQRQIMNDKLEFEKVQLHSIRGIAGALFRRKPSLLGILLRFLF